MDKTLFNFSVTWHNAKGQYLGLCEEFSFLSYLSDSDHSAYQGILHLTCDFIEHIEKYRDEAEYDQWFSACAQVRSDNRLKAVSHKQAHAEIHAFVELKERRHALQLALPDKSMLLATRRGIIEQ